MSEQRFPWRTLLFVSVALNLLVVGVAVGAYSAGVRPERATAEAVVDRMPGPRAFIAALPAPTRAKMRQELVQSWDQSRELRRAANDARRDAFTAAATEPYDAARVGAAFARLRAADQAAIGVFHDDVIAAFGHLTPEERRAAVAALREAPPATRQRIGPREERITRGAEGGDQATPRERLRERLRERRRERREQRQP